MALENILEQNIMFVESFKPYDFTKNMGQYAVEITYSNKETQMLTTPSTKENVNSKGDLSVEDFFKLIDKLQNRNM